MAITAATVMRAAVGRGNFPPVEKGNGIPSPYLPTRAAWPRPRGSRSCNPGDKYPVRPPSEHH